MDQQKHIDDDEDDSKYDQFMGRGPIEETPDNYRFNSIKNTNNQMDNFYTLRLRKKQKNLMGVMYDDDVDYTQEDPTGSKLDLDILALNRF